MSNVLVVYDDGSEVLVCNRADEEKLIEDYFMYGGRLLDDYSRVETDEIVQIGVITSTSVTRELK